LRIKLGRKQIPDRYGKNARADPAEGPDDVKSMAGDLDGDQWAEIHNHDFELY